MGGPVALPGSYPRSVDARRSDNTATAPKFLIGTAKFAEHGDHPKIMFDAGNVINPHVILAGGSGTGKTHRLRDFISRAVHSSPNVHFHVIDVHGDITVPGESVVKFSDASPYGLNALRVSPDPNFGGVRKRMRSFVTMLNRTSVKLGTKQEAALNLALADMYEAAGFLVDNPLTWSVSFDPRSNPRKPKRQPNISDLRYFCEMKLKQMMIGTSGEAHTALQALMRHYRSVERSSAAAASVGGEEDNEKLKVLKEECKLLYAEFIDAVRTGKELDDLIRQSSKDVMKSVYERVINLESTGIFKDAPPPFDPDAQVWRYDITAMNEDEKVMFTDVLLEDLFFQARQRGIRPFADTYVVIDEANAVMSQDKDAIPNKVAREARKFGLGLWLASQSLEHYPDDIVTNTGTKVVLGIHEKFHEATARQLRIEAKRLGYIKPRRTALVQVVKQDGDTSNRFIDVVLPD